MTLESGITFFIAIFIFGVTPGPGIFAIMAKSMSKGAKASVSLCVGMVMSDIVYLVMACYGLAAIASAWEEVFIAIRYIGAAYLIYLGWKMWTAPIVSPDDQSKQYESQSEMASFLQGFMISASNPKVVLFYIAFLPTFMDLTVLNGADIVLAAILAFVGLMSGISMVSLGAAQARKLMKSERSVRTLNRTSGGIMASAGAFLAFKG
ncbi:LysE family translocator [Marinomonas sp. C2222]|uniref:LysE family translocator n=1 Tax=Marinomonas sargassi TaxID=2984494 RepID=A0ABT2YNH7_9GAMM|nr:LysE family translocator [Marinomonas sargassi]MCV2401438.1 LysE family translocator [Marinomonas sargassi]